MSTTAQETSPRDMPIDDLVEYIERVEGGVAELKNVLAQRLERYRELAGVTGASTPAKRRRTPVPVRNPQTGEVLQYRGGKRPAWLTNDVLTEARSAMDAAA